jgi:hypothetical protein
MISMDAIIQVIEATIAARDPYSVYHQQRVTQLACLIASEMDLPEGQERSLPHMASLDLSHVYPGHSFGGALDPVNFRPFISNPYPAHHFFHDHFTHRKMVITCTSKAGNSCINTSKINLLLYQIPPGNQMQERGDG